MAIATTSQVLNDGPRNTIIHLTGIGDGQGDVSLGTIVDISTLSQPVDRVRVKRVTYDISYGVVRLLWEANTNVEFLVLGGQGGGSPLDYSRFGGIPNKAGETATGNILYDTIGFELNSTFTITLELVKRYGHTSAP